MEVRRVMMADKNWIPVVRWVARIWSLFPIIWAILEVISPHSEEGIEVPVSDYVNLSIIGVCLLGLALAWRWEKLGGWIALVALGVFTVVFMLTKENVFPAILIIVLGLGIPAGMFLAVSSQE
jgi:hypothetical protein